MEKIDKMVFSMTQDKVVSFAILIPPIAFVIPNEFNDAVECKAFLSQLELYKRIWPMFCRF